MTTCSCCGKEINQVFVHDGAVFGSSCIKRITGAKSSKADKAIMVDVVRVYSAHRADADSQAIYGDIVTVVIAAKKFGNPCKISVIEDNKAGLYSGVRVGDKFALVTSRVILEKSISF